MDRPTDDDRSLPDIQDFDLKHLLFDPLTTIYLDTRSLPDFKSNPYSNSYFNTLKPLSGKCRIVDRKL